MKKNVMMRLSALLLVAVLLTTCVISGTFAKYVTSNQKDDVAQVAKWGVTVEADFDDLFEEYYDNATGTVQAAETYNILAPGTTDAQDDAFVISGTPEVAVNINVVAAVTLTGWTLEDDSEYCPLVITVNSVAYYIGATIDEETIDDVADLEAAVEAAIQDALGHGDHEANVNLAANLDISWSWAFEQGADADEIKAFDEKDTYLGDQAAAGNAPTFAVDVKVTVTQID